MRLSVVLLSLLLLGALGCNQRSGAIESRATVRGSVKVAGKAAPGLIVRFHLEAGTADERAPKLVEALTDAEGIFSVSQNAPHDGLAPGKYVVTFFWPPGGDPDAPASADQLKGRYSNPDKSQVRIEVQSRSNELPPFELKKSAGSVSRSLTPHPGTDCRSEASDKTSRVPVQHQPNFPLQIRAGASLAAGELVRRGVTLVSQDQRVSIGV